MSVKLLPRRHSLQLLLVWLMVLSPMLTAFAWISEIGPFRPANERMLNVDLRGLTREQLISRYGNPDFTMPGGQGEELVEYYVGRQGAIGITLKDGTVTHVGASAH